MGRRKIKDDTDARACLAAVRQSGGDLVAWAREHGVDARSLNAWRFNLGRGARAKRRMAGKLDLVELVPASTEGGARYVVDLGTARIELDEQCSADALERIVRALRAC